MINRRKFLKSGVVNSTLLLTSGCCNFRQQPSIQGVLARDRGSDSFLSTSKLFSNRAGFRPAIDAHAHFFNATDLQAGGYLAGPIASEWGINGSLMEAAGGIIDALARNIAPSAFAEFQYLDTLEQKGKGRSGKDIYKQLDDDIVLQNKLISQELYKELNKTRFPEVYRQKTNKLRSLDSGYEFSESLIRRVLDDDRELDIEIGNLKSREANQSRMPLSIFSFLGKMLSYRTHNIHRYRKAFFENGGDIKVVCAANAMVDFDRWVGKCDRSFSSLSNQIKLYDRLARVHDNFIFNLVSFNPWTAIKLGDLYYQQIEFALDLDSFKGVKIYPPIGYYPMGNSGATQPKWPKGHPNTQKIDNELQRIYEVCNSRGIPIMAHGNYSMGAIPEFKQLGGPKRWKSALDKNVGLKVNIGHFGGDYKVGEEEWTPEFLKLMKKYPGLRGDIGKWDKLYNPNEIERFKEFLDYPISVNENGSSRILYGSDWFMITKNKGWQNYAKIIYNNLKGKVPPEDLDRVFYSNAKSFFGLDGYIKWR